MAIKFENGQAECADCPDKFEGPFEIKIDDWAVMSGKGVAEGELPERCLFHHSEKGGEEGQPPHDLFGVSSGDKMIGEMRVAGTTLLQTFTITDQSTFREFNRQVRALREFRSRRF